MPANIISTPALAVARDAHRRLSSLIASAYLVSDLSLLLLRIPLSFNLEGAVDAGGSKSGCGSFSKFSSTCPGSSPAWGKSWGVGDGEGVAIWGEEGAYIAATIVPYIDCVGCCLAGLKAKIAESLAFCTTSLAAAFACIYTRLLVRSSASLEVGILFVKRRTSSGIPSGSFNSSTRRSISSFALFRIPSKAELAYS